MCDVIKIRLKRKDERRIGKETPKKAMDNKRFNSISFIIIFSGVI